MKLLTKPRPSLEIIDFQDTTLGIQMETILTEMQSMILRSQYDTVPMVRSLESLIFKRLGLKTNIITNAGLAAILPFYSNKNHIFLHPYWRGQASLVADQDRILRDAADRPGGVDLKHARVSGIFSEYTNLVYMNYIELFTTYHMTPAEVTAVMLHELGHGFYACEYSDRLASTNQVLANVALELTGKKDRDLKYIYKELKSINADITETDVDHMTSGPSVIAGYYWFKALVGTVESQKANDTYDRTAFEQVADNFAARFGYGRPLITALERLHDYYGNPERSRSWSTINLVLSCGWLVGITAAIIGLVAASIPVGLLYAVFFVLIFRASGDGLKDYTYDGLRDRYKRVRNEYIALLKDTAVPKDELKQILEAVYAMDTVISNTNEHRNIFNILSNLLFKVNRDARSAIQEEKMLEELAFNDLFLKSAELRAQ
jgi:hypothetical protein